MKKRYLKLLAYTLIALLIVGVNNTRAAGDAPLISGFKMGNVSASLMNTDTFDGNVIEFTHDSPVSVDILMKLPGGGWELLRTSDPEYEGHVLQVDIPAGIDHAWFRILSDYQPLMDTMAENAEVPVEALPEPGSDDFEEQLTVSGFEYVDMGDGAVIMQSAVESFDALSGMPVDATANNQAKATPDPGRSKVYWHNSSAGYVADWGITTGAVRKASQLITESSMDSSWECAAVVDLNDDGYEDIIWHKQSSGLVAAWILAADGYREVDLGGRIRKDDGSDVSLSSEWQLKAVGKIDSDDYPDLIWHNQTGGRVAAWLLDWDGTNVVRKFAGSVVDSEGSALSLATSWQISAYGELNGDDSLDLIWHNQSGGRVAAWFLTWDGSDVVRSFSGSVVDTNGATLSLTTTWQISAFGTIDGDDKLDLVWHNQSGGRVAAWLLDWDGSDVVRKHSGSVVDENGSTLSLLTSWQIRAFKDINNDTKTDLFWHNQSGGRVAAWFLNYDGTNVYREFGGSITDEEGSPLSLATAWDMSGVGY